MTRVLITGVTGQDGSYLAEQLSSQGHHVFGLVRGQSNPKRAWLQRLVPSLKLVEGDLLDQSSLQRAIAATEPEVIYNLGAITYVGLSWTQPTVMTEVTGLGCLRLLEAVRQVNPEIRVLQASSSEMFGEPAEKPQRETTPLRPVSPYGTAKAFAHQTTVNYRQSFGIHASTAIMFNHESPRRGEEFVTTKVAAAVARIVRGNQKTVELGNLHARRDWGWAPDYMTALPLITARDEPDDYVIATGRSHSVEELCQHAFGHVGLDWEEYVVVAPAHFRPTDIDELRGDAGRASRRLHWRASVHFADIVRMLVDAQLARP